MLSASGPLSPNQVVALAREAMKSALQENETQAAEASGVSTDLKPGITIDLSRKNIQALPDEVVDIIKNELERFVPAILGCLVTWSHADMFYSCIDWHFRITSCHSYRPGFRNVHICAIST